MSVTFEDLDAPADDDAVAYIAELLRHSERDAIEKKKSQLRIDRAARRELDLEEGPPAAPSWSVTSIAEIAERDQSDTYRVTDLLPHDSNLLIVGKRKAGKTTLLLNLASSLISGHKFLDEFEVKQVHGTVALLSYEMSDVMLARWAKRLPGLDALRVVQLRGGSNPLATESGRQLLAEQLREHQVETLIVDTFARSFTGSSQNDAGEVSRFLTDLELMVRDEIGARDLILTVHAGWDAERSRGSSALEDWPDSILTITTLDDQDPESPRFVRAFGRDTSLDERQVAFDEHTRMLSLGVGDRGEVSRSRKSEALVPIIVDVIRAAGGSIPSGEQLRAAVRAANGTGQDPDIRRAAAEAHGRGLIVIIDGGKGKAKTYSLPEEACAPDNPGRPPTT